MGLKLNFSSDEANSVAREIPPSGEYDCKVTEIEDRKVQPGRTNAGKPYWNVTFVIQSGPYRGSQLYSNIMLFRGKDGTLNRLAQFLKACGFDIVAGDVEIPEASQLISRDLKVRGRKLLAGFDKKADRDLPDRFDVSGYKPAKAGTKSGDASRLP